MFRGYIFQHVRQLLLHRRWSTAGRRGLFLDHRPRRRRIECFRSPDGYCRSGECAGSAPECAKAAVVGYPHEIKGQGSYACVTLMQGVQESDPLVAELRDWVGKEIGPIAKPDCVQWAPRSPKTQSGKNMRRNLGKIAEKDVTNLGDVSTLADTSVVSNLVRNRPD